MRIRPLVAWYDLWIGAYWDRARRRLYVLPIPCVGVVIEFGDPADEILESILAANDKPVATLRCPTCHERYPYTERRTCPRCAMTPDGTAEEALYG